MRIDGEWYPCDDGTVRPIIRGEVLGAGGTWQRALFLVDTGADCTFFSAAMFDVLGFELHLSDRRLGGVGGISDSAEIATQILIPYRGGGSAVFRGQYSAATEFESLDISILGRDILNLFSVIVDRPSNVVALIRPPHRYAIAAS